MIIQTLERGFSVIKVVRTGYDADIYICRDMLENSERHYLILCLKNPDLIYHTMPFFTRQKKNRAFHDFVECFSQDGQFHVVFRYTEKPLLEEKLEEGSYSLQERLIIGKSLVSQMTLQNMDPRIQYEALLRRNLLLDDTLTVHFNYILEEVGAYEIMPAARMQTALAGVFRLIFDQEISGQVCQELIDFVQRLEEGVFKDYLEIYQAFDEVCDILEAMTQAEKAEPQSFLFRLWEKIKRAARLAKPLAAGLIVAVALGFLIYTLTTGQAITASTVPATGGTYIDQIGTVVIE